MLDQSEIKAAIEALLFMATEPLQIKEIKKVLTVDRAEIKESLEKIKLEYAQQDKGIELVKINRGYQLQTKAEYSSIIKDFHQPEVTKTLSQAALETLAIVAYKQPVTRAEVEDIRGVNVEKALKTLQKRGLIAEQGRKDVIGKPIIYGTTNQFLEYLGLESLDDLPEPKEFAKLNNEELEEIKPDAN
ncbi:SMC-Scp complex subunit ScpB [Natroniella sulfidigena]|uniref:SMC-Scp complex subunit ScpB n=1 Tax=Natroniella sulfidigena TaxID=723921 RepID=UPI00200AE854|nr:SMC-Scp complex subunit ScpB [Natroniella sulfidigena]MCK8816572.1 SMC-Scp complex subunit ScpB [Natroniella sulfidigena]